ncbi:hypothetical protein GGX14DRAFT_384086 [Mycena pura]|uniref:Uncharacterized protein n=1 Tax=Mycena pura TaxID=153505 RepID=A0AAD6YUP9_9AGAR|nr:hypothetical protein GGX14DRAFT_384086 [Mycena pura]
MSHCIVVARLPFISVERATTGHRYSIKTVLYQDDDIEHDANLTIYTETGPPPEGGVFDLEATFANNGGSDTNLASDFRALQLLGSGSPSSPDYMATCPDLVAPLFNVLGTVGFLDDDSFTLAGNSYIAGPQPFTVKVVIDRSNKRWDKVKPPQPGSLVAITGKLLGREDDDTGLFMINLRNITYIPSALRSSPTKSLATAKGGGSKTWSQSQRESKSKRPRSEDDDDKGQGTSASPSKRSTKAATSAPKPT